MDIKDFVSKGQAVTFQSYRQGFFYYAVTEKSSGWVYEFTIPIEDIGSATLLQTDKAITYMRWIRKAIENKSLILIKAQSADWPTKIISDPGMGNGVLPSDYLTNPRYRP